MVQEMPHEYTLVANPVGNWRREGPYRIELRERADTSRFPARMITLLPFDNHQAFDVRKGTLVYCDGVFSADCEIGVFPIEQSNVVCVRDQNGDLVWVNHPMFDWTADEHGRSNSSSEYRAACMTIERIIRASGRDLINGMVEPVARNIMSELVHMHRLAPPTRR
jgi:hypothetical protein